MLWENVDTTLNLVLTLKSAQNQGNAYSDQWKKKVIIIREP